MPIWLSLVVGAVASAAPSLIPFIPQPFGAIVTAILSLGNGIYHLLQQPPK